MEWEQDISMFDWFFTPNNTSSKVIAITIGTIKYCYNTLTFHLINSRKDFLELIEKWNDELFVNNFSIFLKYYIFINIDQFSFSYSAPQMESKTFDSFVLLNGMS